MPDRLQDSKHPTRRSDPSPMDEDAMRAIDAEARAYRQAMDSKIARIECLDQEDLRIRVR